MKRILLVLAIVAMAFSAEAATLNLRCNWNLNTEADIKEYKLFRTDGPRTLLGTIAHPTTTFDFSIDVPDNASGMLNFVLRAVDLANQESSDSPTASYVWNTDTPPGAPAGVIVIPR
jgi:hypothetical protein